MLPIYIYIIISLSIVPTYRLQSVHVQFMILGWQTKNNIVPNPLISLLAALVRLENVIVPLGSKSAAMIKYKYYMTKVCVLLSENQSLFTCLS